MNTPLSFIKIITYTLIFWFTPVLAQNVDTISSDDIEFTEITEDTSTSNDSLSVLDQQEKVAQALQGSTVKAGDETDISLWQIFINGLLFGFAAILMPCIFPMLPLTVSFFTKRAGTRARAIGQATIYGLSIIIIYVALGMLVTIFFGSDALNALSTNGIFNFLFFLLLVAFGASFLGAFEITLPSSFVNKIDAKSDQGGLIGIFFMAFSLALVSFSCTGPLIGTLLV
ncbi:cytochrome c biogenesis protein CcdA, partial [Olivibacter domesticus]